jgi:hypothetical protein
MHPRNESIPCSSCCSIKLLTVPPRLAHRNQQVEFRWLEVHCFTSSNTRGLRRFAPKLARNLREPGGLVFRTDSWPSNFLTMG